MLPRPVSDPGRRRFDRGGFALVLVLIALTLVTALTVFFMSGVGRERIGVDQYSRGSEARHLADTTVNLVQAQINAATKEGTAAVPVSWASQPGMIRTYATDGTLSNAYKLYSWDNLVENGPNGSGTVFNPTAASELPDSSWYSLPAQYTDLNAPVNGVYPIADPTIANSGAASAMTQSSTVPWDFPSEFAVATDASGYHASSTNTLPMPVKWLYVLQDGTWVTPASATGNSATFAGSTAPSKTNPIVGRIAFWTDDETSKVNVNTASEGSFWDTPKAATADEMQFAANPPVKNEFQRLAGHPATTSLSAVFPEMRQGTFNRWTNVGTPSTPNSYLGQLKDIYDLVPRIDWSQGGSQGGTYPITSYNATYQPQASLYPWTDPNTYVITPDANRLFATADDVWFQPLPTSKGASRAGNVAFTDYNLTPAQAARRLFLFTANSRAPETTLFETPRISLWPVTWPNTASAETSSFYVNSGVGSATYRTVKPTSLDPNTSTLAALFNDQNITPQELLLAFSSTLNQGGTSLPYYFQRQAPDSPTWDLSNKIQRNLNVVSYLRSELGTAMPGMGGNLTLATKWDGGGTGTTDWITLNCFDYVRSLVNQYTFAPYPTAAQMAAPYNGLLYSYTGLGDATHSEPNSFTVAPLHTTMPGGGATTYTTEGTYPALNEVSIEFFATSRLEPQPPTTSPLISDVLNPDKWLNLISWNPTAKTGSSQTTSMKAVMLFGFSQMNPGVYSYKGNTNYTPAFWIKVTALGGGPVSVNGASINLPGATNHSVQFNTLQPYAGGGLAPSIAALFYKSKTVAKMFSNTGSGAAYWSLTSNSIPLSPTNNSFAFTGALLQVDIYAPDPSGNLDLDPTNTAACLVSSQQVDFSQWSGTFPIPLAPRWNVRQAPMSPVTPTTSNVTAGVLMPNYNTVSTLNPNWQTEIVPDIPQFGQGTPSLLSLDPRSSTSTLAAGQDSTAGQGTNGQADPMTYVYKDISTQGTATGVSTDFATRVLKVLATGATTQAETNTSGYTAVTPTGNLYGGSQGVSTTQAYQVITPYDTVISMVSNPAAASAGDPRLMGRGVYTTTGTTSFVRIDTAMALTGFKPTHVFTRANAARSTDQMQFHALNSPSTTPLLTGYRADFKFGNTLFAQRGSQTQRSVYPATSGSPSNGLMLGRNVSDSELGVEANVTMALDPNGDWTALPGNFMDGGYLARPDQEYQSVAQDNVNNIPALNVPYFSEYGLTNVTSGKSTAAAAFSPNRQVPSPVILGTIPSSLTNGWQTLDFCPNPARAMNTGTHPGLGVQKIPSATGAVYTTLPDHLLLDLFWMPVAEPYPISEQFSTAGKVNLNYAMMPFPYILRKSALDAVLKAVNITALPSGNANFLAYYKSYGMLYQTSRLDQTHTRFPVDVDATLKAFDYKFSKGDIFRSASQVCDVFLYPNDPNTPNQLLAGVSADTPPAVSSITSWWNGNQLTGDNAREAPYNAIYSRVTTKSNTFTVHWKVQALKKRPNSDPATWTENQDVVSSELRGSTLIERYLDPNATNLPDYATDTGHTAQPLSQFYKWRVAAENYFRP